MLFYDNITFIIVYYNMITVSIILYLLNFKGRIRNFLVVDGGNFISPKQITLCTSYRLKV